MSAADPTDRNPPEDRLNRQRERMSRDYDEDDDIGPRTPMEPTDADGPVGRGRGVLSSLTRVLGSGLLGGNDPMTRKLLLGAAGLGGLLIVFVGGWSLFGHHQNGIPVIGPPPGALRVKPTDPGGMQVLGADGPGAGDGGDGAHMAPGPEQPRPDAMARQYGQADTPPAPAAGDGAAPAQAGPAAPGVQAQPLASAQQPDGSASAPPAAPAPQAEPAQEEEAASDEEEHAPAPAPAAHHATATHAATGQYGVQLAALDSEAAAQKSWGRLQHQYASLFGDRQPAIVRAEHNGTVFYRLRVKGFASTAQASAFCQQVKAHGLACNPVRF